MMAQKPLSSSEIIRRIKASGLTIYDEITSHPDLYFSATGLQVNFRTFRSYLSGGSQGFQQELEFFIMYGRNTEHRFYYLGPKFATKGGQRVGEAGRALVRIPRPNDEIAFVALSESHSKIYCKKRFLRQRLVLRPVVFPFRRRRIF